MVRDSFNAIIGLFSGRWWWSRPPTSLEELDEWRNLFTLICGARLNSDKDRWVWRGPNSNGMTVKAVKEFMRSAEDYTSRYVFNWSYWVPNKVNIFMWRLIMERIPTVDALKNRNCFLPNEVCVLCETDSKTVNHLFCSCGVATIVWQFIRNWCRASPFFLFSPKDLVVIHEFVGLEKKERKALKGIIIVACWCLWKCRNEKRFSNIDIKVDKLLLDIRSLGYLWYRNRKKNVNIERKDWCNVKLI
uniref:uncharacterized protein LOC122583102 n=1 Tax=Erigeron canadensis TaxID=72917 RepID=UPI001CB8D500|nr:uncharacterized protein LOC122583102 [Erigeron canadensis]